MLVFLKKHLYETVLAVIILVFGSAIAAFIESVGFAVSAYPLQVALLCGCSFTVALLISAAIDRRHALIAKIHADKELDLERMRHEAEEREAAAEIEREEAAREAEKRAQVYQYSPAQLHCMVVCLCNEKTDRGIGIRLKGGDPVAESLVDVGMMDEVYERPTGKFIYSLTLEGRRFVVEREKDIRAYLDELDQA